MKTTEYKEGPKAEKDFDEAMDGWPGQKHLSHDYLEGPPA